MTRRRLLLWGVPAALGLAVVAGITVLVLGRSEASRKANEIQLGMTLEQVHHAIGTETWFGPINWIPPRPTSDGRFWQYDDGSRLLLIFDNGRLTRLRVESTNPSWYDRLRTRLRSAGLPI